MKNIRDTSIEAYKNIIESGYLSAILIKVFDIIFRFGPMTSREANEHFVEIHGGDDNLNQLRSKISLLQDLGVIKTTDKVKCSDTLKNVYRFDVTGRMPTKVKKPSMADKKRDMMATLARIEPWMSSFAEGELDLLKQQISNL